MRINALLRKHKIRSVVEEPHYRITMEDLSVELIAFVLWHGTPGYSHRVVRNGVLTTLFLEDERKPSHSVAVEMLMRLRAKGDLSGIKRIQLSDTANGCGAWWEITQQSPNVLVATAGHGAFRTVVTLSKMADGTLQNSAGTIFYITGVGG